MNCDQAPISTQTCPEGVCPVSAYDTEEEAVVDTKNEPVGSDTESETPQRAPADSAPADSAPEDQPEEEGEEDEPEDDDDDDDDDGTIFVVMIDSSPVYWSGERRMAEIALEEVAQKTVLKYVGSHHVTRDDWTDHVQIYGSKKNTILNWGAALLHTVSLHEVEEYSLV